MVPATVTLRVCTQDDVPAVRELLIATWQFTYGDWLGPDKTAEVNEIWHSLERLQSQARHQAGCFLLAERGNLLLGTSFAHDLGDDEVELGRLYVRPGYHRQGIGQALLTATLEAFPTSRLCRLQVDPRNSAAIGLYARNGFRVAATSPGCHVGPPGCQCLQMERVAG